VAELPQACADLRLVAPELALGTLDGPTRGDALAHVARCDVCRAHVQELAEVVDRLIAVAPEAEPPPGFESSVIDRIAAEPDEVSARRRGPSRLVLAAAAVVLLLAGSVAGFLIAERSPSDSGEIATAKMEAPSGDDVGEVWRYGDSDATLFVSVPAWADIEGEGGPRYALRLGLDDGERLEVGDFGLGDGSSSWAVSADV
jgi:hypothetical protein